MMVFTSHLFQVKEVFKEEEYVPTPLRNSKVGRARSMYKQPKPDTILFKITGNLYYLVWWLISDSMPEKMEMCENLASIVCDTSLLKMTDYSLKQKTIGFKMCNRCDLGIPENAWHIIMQCPYNNDERVEIRAGLDTHGDSELAFLEDRYSRNAYSNRPSRLIP